MITEGDQPKPPELTNLYEATAEAFGTIKEVFGVPGVYELLLHDIDAAEPFLQNTLDIAAVAMRKIQALRWVAKSGTKTTNDIVVTLAADLLRTLEHLMTCCPDDAAADALAAFQRQVIRAARRAEGDGGIRVLR